MAALQLGQHFLERNVELDEKDEGMDEEVGDFGDLPLAGFVDGGDDDLERFFADFLGDAGGASGEELGGCSCLRGGGCERSIRISCSVRRKLRFSTLPPLYCYSSSKQLTRPVWQARAARLHEQE